MDATLKKQFESMGARVKVDLRPGVDTSGYGWQRRQQLVRTPNAVRIDIGHDEQGEFFDLQHRRDVKVVVADVQARDAHLLVHVALRQGARRAFLCGHDERSWFVAAIPETAEAKTVQEAKDALKPAAVWESMRVHRVPMEQRDLRKTKAFVRQGEWFFIPRPRAEIVQALAVRNEPIRRGAGKPHMCQFLYRIGGTEVHVCEKYPNGLTAKQFRELSSRERNQHDWRTMYRDAQVFVRGAIRHPDHDTIWLPVWHQVEMNTESKAAAMRDVAFLD